MQASNEAKAKVLYDAIADSNGFYNNPVDPAVRSLMNVPFTIPSKPDLEKVRACACGWRPAEGTTAGRRGFGGGGGGGRHPTQGATAGGALSLQL